MSASDYVEEAFLKLMFGRQTWAPAPVYYFGLSATPIADPGTGASEPTGGAYQRVAVPNIPGNFSFSGGQITNGTVIAFPIASSAWGDVAYWFAADLPSGGTVHIRGSISPAQSIASGERLYFDTGSLAITMD